MSLYARRIVPTIARARPFSTLRPLQKSVTETAKDTLKAADRTVSDQLVKGINAGEKIADSAQSAINSASGEAKGTASSASGDASKMAGQAQGKASELTGEAKGKASELAGQAKGKVEEVKGKL